MNADKHRESAIKEITSVLCCASVLCNFSSSKYPTSVTCCGTHQILTSICISSVDHFFSVLKCFCIRIQMSQCLIWVW